MEYTSFGIYIYILVGYLALFFMMQSELLQKEPKQSPVRSVSLTKTAAYAIKSAKAILPFCTPDTSDAEIFGGCDSCSFLHEKVFLSSSCVLPSL